MTTELYNRITTQISAENALSADGALAAIEHATGCSLISKE